MIVLDTNVLSEVIRPHPNVWRLWHHGDQSMGIAYL